MAADGQLAQKGGIRPAHQPVGLAGTLLARQQQGVVQQDNLVGGVGELAEEISFQVIHQEAAMLPMSVLYPQFVAQGVYGKGRDVVIFAGASAKVIYLADEVPVAPEDVEGALLFVHIDVAGGQEPFVTLAGASQLKQDAVVGLQGDVADIGQLAQADVRLGIIFPEVEGERYFAFVPGGDGVGGLRRVGGVGFHVCLSLGA